MTPPIQDVEDEKLDYVVDGGVWIPDPTCGWRMLSSEETVDRLRSLSAEKRDLEAGSADLIVAMEALVRERDALSARVAELEAGLRELRCPSCGGAGTYKQRSRGAGLEIVPCSVCSATGQHPLAARLSSPVGVGNQLSSNTGQLK